MHLNNPKYIAISLVTNNVSAEIINVSTLSLFNQIALSSNDESMSLNE